MKSIGVFLLFCLSLPAWSSVFYLPENDSIVGQIQYVKAKKSDTLLDIARHYNVGYNEIVRANPHVDPWLPEDGAHVVIPSRFILPPGPWRGIVINLAEMRLYYFPEQTPFGHGAVDNSVYEKKKLVYTFPIGIGRTSWPTPLGDFSVVEKIENPTWTVPPSVIEEALREGIDMPRTIAPGEDNPLGDHAMLLNETGYLIHGTNKPLSVGRRVSHGCIRLYPEDIEQLVSRVPRGTPVRIIEQSVKSGIDRGVLYLESNINNENRDTVKPLDIVVVENVIANVSRQYNEWFTVLEKDAIDQLITASQSIPMPVKKINQPKSANSPFLLKLDLNADKSINHSLTQTLRPLSRLGGAKTCHSHHPCLRLGPFQSREMLYAFAELIKYGFGVASHVNKGPGARKHAVPGL